MKQVLSKVRIIFGTHTNYNLLSSYFPVPPRFIKELGDVDICRDEDANLLCQFIGFPEPELTWFKSEELFNTEALNDRTFYRVSL